MPHVELSLSDEHGRDRAGDTGREAAAEPAAEPATEPATGPATGPAAGPGSEPVTGPWSQPPEHRQAGSVSRWCDTVRDAFEPCLVLDSDGVIVACSRAALLLLGGTPEAPADSEWLGRGLLDVLRLIDLTAAGAPLAPWEAERVPPLLALSTGSLARGLMRIRLGELTRTVDVVSTPLWDAPNPSTGRAGPAAVGSLSFLCRI